MATSSRKRRVIMGAVTVLVVGVVGVVYASWISSSNGSGSAEAINGKGVEFATAATAQQLYPGSTGDVKLQLTNPNPYPIKVTKVERTSAPTTSNAGAACDAATGVTVENDANVTGFNLAASGQSGDSATLTMTNKAHMNNTSDTTCQGAKFSIPVTVTSESTASNTSAGS